MLGVALNAQRAGWGEQPFQVNISSDSVVSQALYQTPSYSFLFNASDRNWDVDPGDYDLTGYSSISGFNNRRYTGMMNVYLPWPSGLANGYYGNPLSMQINKSGDSLLFWTITFDIVSGSLLITSGYDNVVPQVTLSGAYTDYTNRWLTFVATGAETSSVFTNWTGGSSGSNYNRLAVYDTQTAVLLGKTDTTDSQRRANVSGYGNSVSSFTGDADAVGFAGYSGGGEQIRQAGIWMSLGTMFDPLTETSDVWLTTRPGAVVGNATAWMNATATTYYNSGSGYWMDEDTDIFVPDTADQILSLTNGGNAAFTTGYSTTIIPKDQS